MIWLLSTVSVAACLKASTQAEIDARLSEAEAAWSALDPEGFSGALDDAVLMLPCLSDVATPTFSARYHRLVALRNWGAGEVERATWSMQAARILDPRYEFTDDLLAPDHELRVAYAALPSEEGGTRRPARPKGGTLWFDGVPAIAPVERATIVQVVEDDALRQTRLVRPGDPLPAYDAVPRVRNGFLAGSAVFLATGIGLYAGAWGAHRSFYEGGWSEVSDLRRLKSESQILTGTALGCTVVAGAGVGLAFGLGGN